MILFSKDITWIIVSDGGCEFIYNRKSDTNSKYSLSIINSLTDKSTKSSINFLYLLSLKFIKPDNTMEWWVDIYSWKISNNKSCRFGKENSLESHKFSSHKFNIVLNSDSSK